MVPDNASIIIPPKKVINWRVQKSSACAKATRADSREGCVGPDSIQGCSGAGSYGHQVPCAWPGPMWSPDSRLVKTEHQGILWFIQKPTPRADVSTQVSLSVCCTQTEWWSERWLHHLPPAILRPGGLNSSVPCLENRDKNCMRVEEEYQRN